MHCQISLVESLTYFDFTGTKSNLIIVFLLAHKHSAEWISAIVIRLKKCNWLRNKPEIQTFLGDVLKGIQQGEFTLSTFMKGVLVIYKRNLSKLNFNWVT